MTCVLCAEWKAAMERYRAANESWQLGWEAFRREHPDADIGPDGPWNNVGDYRLLLPPSVPTGMYPGRVGRPGNSPCVGQDPIGVEEYVSLFGAITSTEVTLHRSQIARALDRVAS